MIIKFDISKINKIPTSSWKNVSLDSTLASASSKHIQKHVFWNSLHSQKRNEAYKIYLCTKQI